MHGLAGVLVDEEASAVVGVVHDVGLDEAELDGARGDVCFECKYVICIEG